MIRRALGLALALALWAGAAASQAEPAAAPEDEPPDPAMVMEMVRAALADLLAAEEEAPVPVTTNDPEVPLPELELLVEPLTLAEITVEMQGWLDLLRGAVEEVTAAERELLQRNAALAAAEEAAAAKAGAEATADPDGQAAAPAEDSDREALVERIAELREVRTGLHDRLKLVMDAYEGKGGAPADTAEMRAYGQAVSGVTVDVSDAETTLLTLRAWASSEEGGLRILRQGSALALSVVIAGLAGWLLSFLINLGLKHGDLSSTLLRHFLRRLIVRMGVLVGLLVGLAEIGVNMTPILAGLGAAGFVLAFALQNTIGNFASGLLILVQRPFDLGDEVDAGGVSGVVERVTLFSTHMSTAENRKVIVPNNKIWEDVIMNSTSAETRRLVIEVEVDATAHSIDEAEAKLIEVMRAHPDVLNDPAPELRLSSVSAESLTFLCWPWVPTAKKDKARWELVAGFGRALTILRGVTKAAS